MKQQVKHFVSEIDLLKQEKWMGVIRVCGVNDSLCTRTQDRSHWDSKCKKRVNAASNGEISGHTGAIEQ